MSLDHAMHPEGLRAAVQVPQFVEVLHIRLSPTLMMTDVRTRHGSGRGSPRKRRAASATSRNSLNPQLARITSRRSPSSAEAASVQFPAAPKNVENPFAPLLYTISAMHCTPISIGQGGPGLGAMWGVETAKEYLAEAGFGGVETHRLPHDPLNAYFVARP